MSHVCVLDGAAVRLVQETHAMVNCIAGTAGTIFYMYLFENHPHVCELFTGDIHSLKLKFMATLRSVVCALDHPHSLSALAQHLVGQTVTSRVLVEHTDAIEEALVWALHVSLGPAFTAEVRAAWVDVYRCIVALIRQERTAVDVMKA